MATEPPTRPEKQLEDDKASKALTQHESRAVAKGKAGTSRVIHEVIRLQGDEELNRPAISLALAGLAAGIGITASVVAQAAIAMRLGDGEWTSLVAGLGYSIGFIIVVMGRLQLFTENTITAVLPIIHNPTMRNLGRLARLWSIVFFANLAGTFIVALGIAHGGIITPELRTEIIGMSQHLMAAAPADVFGRAIPAGFLVASIAWLLPSARGQELGIIIVITWLIAIGGFSHVTASSTEMWTAVLIGDISLSAGLTGFLFPALLGNILGGTCLFALLAHGQVSAEL